MDELYQGGINNFDYYIRCPVCGSENVHIAGIIINQNGEVTEVTSSGVKTVHVKSEHRGSVVKIVFWCEGNMPPHYFVKTLQFHKGKTFQEVQLLDVDRELWRD
mgnify:CR=1 FL=1